MTTITKLVSVLAALAASSSMFAQTAPLSPQLDTTAGLVGHRYAEYSLGYVDGRHGYNDYYAADATFNLPVAPSFDVALSYTYAWLEKDSSTDSHDISATGLYYFNSGKLKPFGGLSLGYDWASGDNAANWGAVAGVEYEINPQVVLTGTVGYSDDFKKGDHSTFDGTVRANYWFTKTFSAYASLTLIEGGSRGYAAGVTMKF